MSQLFLSHSSANNDSALALRDWLIEHGWDDLFLDMDPQRGIVAGERWERALHQAANRCDAILFLISDAWLSSEWCRREFRLAQKLNKQIFGLLIEDLSTASLPAELTDSWQLVDLAGGSDHEAAREVTLPDGRHAFVYFSSSGLARLKAGLSKAGLDPRFFPWPPANDHMRPPYRGLLPLESEDAGIFFGREASIIELLGRVRGLRETAPPRFLAILGASGSGKSSFLRAGLLPRLSRDDRYYLPLPVIRPEQAVLSGSNGLLQTLVSVCSLYKLPHTRRQLQQALESGVDALQLILTELSDKARYLSSAGEAEPVPPNIVLSIDQAEELFLSEGQAEAKQFLSLLRALLQSDNPSLVVICTIRSESYEFLQITEELEGINQHTFSLPPLPQGSYQQVIEGPAKLLADSDRPLAIEPQLTQALLEDLERGGSKDALPLLAFTLERLYRDYGGDGDLRLDEYKEMGGIEGVIEAAVTKALEQAARDPKVPDDPEECLKLLRRGLIPWLAGIDPQTQSPRRRVAKLNEVPEEARSLIGHFVDHRLLATDTNEAGETTVEPAHEALLRQWSRLRGWLDEDAAALSALDALNTATVSWEANARDPGWLAHTQGRLEDAELIARRQDFSDFISGGQRDYLEACRYSENERKDKELADARKLLEAQKQEASAQKLAAEKSRQVIRRTRVGLGIAMVLIVIASAFAYIARESAILESIAADSLKQKSQQLELEKEQALLTQSNFLMDLARQKNEEGLYDTALLLSLNAYPGVYGGGSERLPPAKFEPLYIAVTEANRLVSLKHLGAVVQHANFSPDGQTVVTASSDHTASLWSVNSGARLHTFSHEKRVGKASFSPNGETVVTASDDGTAVLWSVTSGARLHTLPHEGWVSHANFSPDGQTVVTASRDHTAALWSVDSGARLHTFTHEDEVEHANFSPDGQTVVTASRDHTAALWSVDSGARLHELPHESRVKEVNFHPDGRVLVTASADGAALWSVDSGALLHKLPHEDWVWHANFSSDGRTLVTVSGEGTATLWSLDSGARLHTFTHEDGILHANFSPDGQTVVTASGDHTAALWSVDSGARLHTFRHEYQVFHASFSPDGRTLVTASVDGTAVLWSVTSGWPVHTLTDDDVLASFSPDGRTLVTDSWDGTAALWSVDSGARLHTFPHEDGVFHAQFSPDGQTVVTASGDRTAALWSIDSGARLHTLPHEDGVLYADFSPDGQTLVTASGDGTAALWSVDSGARLHTLPHKDWVQRASFSSDGRTLVSVSWNGTTTLWSVTSGARLYTLSYEDSFESFSPDGQTLVTISADGTVVLWSVSSGERLHTFRHQYLISSASFSPDGRNLVTATTDGKAILWSVNAGERLHTFRHQSSISTASFSPDGQNLLTASSDYTAALWSVDSGTRLHTLTHEGLVWHASFSPDGRTLVTVSADGTAVLWSASSGARLHTLINDGRVKRAGFSPDGRTLVTGSRYGAAVLALWPILLLDDLVEIAIDRLPKDRTCLTPTEREQYFLADLADEQWIARGCPQFTHANRVTK